MAKQTQRVANTSNRDSISVQVGAISKASSAKSESNGLNTKMANNKISQVLARLSEERLQWKSEQMSLIDWSSLPGKLLRKPSHEHFAAFQTHIG